MASKRPGRGDVSSRPFLIPWTDVLPAPCRFPEFKFVIFSHRADMWYIIRKTTGPKEKR
jgi:hypothetical protein